MNHLDLDFDPPAPRCICCGGAISRWGEKVGFGHRFTYDRCNACGLVFVNPRPTYNCLGRFYETYAQRVEGQSGAVPETPRPSPSARRLIRRMLRHRPTPGGRFLDVGSGAGLVTAAAAERGFEVTALEVDAANAAATSRLAGVRVARGTFEAFDAAPASFDLILMCHVLEHAHDPAAWLTKAARLLDRGGHLWVLLPNFDGIYRRLWGTRDPYFIPPTHLNHFNPRSLAAACERVGLRVRVNRDEYDLPPDLLARRLPAKLRPLAPAARAATWGIERVAKGITALTGSGIFVTLMAAKE